MCPLIVAPVWEKALQEAGFTTLNCYSGTCKKRLKSLTADSGIAIANYDVLRTLESSLMRWKPEVLVGDESHLIKSPSAQRAKSFRRLAWQAKYVRLLTGTPTPNHYGDLWGQMVCLDKDEWGTSYEKFARRYLIRDAMFPSMVVGHRNTEELQDRMLRYASIVRREDAFGPDHWQYVTRTVSLPPQARELYDRLAKEWFVEAGEDWLGADHILKRMIRLQQLAAGYLPTDQGNILEIHDAKIQAVLSDLREIVESEEKAVLFHRFRWEGDTYAREINRAIGSDAAFIQINGDTPIAMRAALVESFNACPGAATAVVQVRSAGVGISLAESTHALFASRGFSFAEDDQARDRIYKPGKGRCVTYYEAERTIDTYISAILASKENVADSIANADREALAYGYIRKKNAK